MQIRQNEHSDGLVILAEHGIRWVDAAGQTAREEVFPVKLFKHRFVTLHDGRTGVGGFTSRPNAAIVLDAAGQEVFRVKLRSFEYDIPMFANVTAGPEPEMLLPKVLDVRIFALDSTPLGKVSTARYASVNTVVQADDDPEYEIVFATRSHAHRRINVRVMNADGSTVSTWSDPDGGWLSFVPLLDDRSLWAVTKEGFTSWDASGERLGTLPAPDADYLRYVIGARFLNHTVVVASGGGYSNTSLLCVYDEERRLVYQEVFLSRTYAVFAVPGADHFYVGTGDTVVRYSIAPR